MASTGLFGSTIGGKASQRRKPFPETPAGVPLKAPAEHLRAVPAFHTPAALHLSAKLTGIDMKGGAAATSGGASSLRFNGIPSKYTLSGTPSPGGGSSLFGDLASLGGGIEGFMSHLSSDIVHTTLGLPMGLAYLAEHPIAGAEGMVKATWQDWSPLFRGAEALASGNLNEAGREAGVFGHHFFDHPLAPILDLVGFISFGAGAAARGAGAVGKLADASRGVSAAEESAASISRVAKVGTWPIVRSASKAGAEAGAKGFDAVSASGKLQRFSHPTDYAYRTYAKTAERLGFKGDQIRSFAEAAVQNDPAARRLFESKAGLKVHKDLSRNPLIRARQAQVAKIGNQLASRSTKLAHVMGDEAMYRRWTTMDKGSRKAAVAKLILDQLSHFHKAGEVIAKKGPAWMAEVMHAPMRDGLVAHSHAVELAGPLGSPEHIAQLKQAADEGYQAILADQHSVPAMREALAKLAKDHANPDIGEKALGNYFNEDWSKANVIGDPTKDAHKVLRDANGQMRLVSRTADQVGKEAFWSSRAVKMLYTNPTKVWKWFLLGASPRYFVNNFVGNSLMLMAATDPISLTRAFVSHVRITRGAKAADRLAENTIRKTLPAAQVDEALAARRAVQAIRGRHWMEQWFGQEYGFGMANRIDPHTGRPLGGIGRKIPTLHKFTHNHADMPQRYMAMNYTMKRIPEYQQEYARLRAGGMSHFAAEMKASSKAAANPAVRQLIRSQVNHMFGQYHTFAGWEQTVQHVVPFYSWMRAISTHARGLLLAEPYKLAMGAAIGTLGNVQTADILGQVPDFMLGALPAKVMMGPLGLLMKSKPGRTALLNTYGMNPYSTVGDMTQAVISTLPGNPGHLRTGESFGTTLNPLVQSAAQEIGGVDLQSGSPIAPSKFGPIAGMYADTFGSLPQWKLLMASLGRGDPSVTKKGNPTLYDHQFEDLFSSWLGAPIKQTNMDTAAADARLQGGKKKKQPYKFPKTIPGL